LQKWLVESLIPDNIARQVLGYLTSLPARPASWAWWAWPCCLSSALALILTIDRTLNGIWRVRRPRPLAQRVLVYWAGMTLGPLLLGASLT
jgi:membrane protein